MAISWRFLMVRQLAAAGLLFLCFPVQAQQNKLVRSQAFPPSIKDLDRLNMTMAWRTYMPMMSQTDGIATLQFFDKQVFVQTRSNILIVLKASTGEEEWRMEMPKRNLPVFPVA